MGQTMLRTLIACLALIAAPLALAAAPQVELKTSMGTVVLELYPDRAPETVKNFEEYVQSGFYNGTVFHRVIPGFMIQGGGFDGSMKQKPTRAPIQNEAANGAKNATGTIAMARTNDPNSATAQFFVNLVDNEFLNHGSRDFGYAVFGRVSSGMDVVQKIAAAPTGTRGGHQNVPLEAVTIQSIRRK